METSTERNLATSVHLSTLSQYFLPFGSFIFPILLWSFKRESEYVRQHGKTVINFQLSMLLYTILVVLAGIIGGVIFAANNLTWNMTMNEIDNLDFESIRSFAGLGLIIGITITLVSLLKISEFILIIIGTVAASEGKPYNYPLTINFIQSTLFEPTAEVQSNVDQQ